MKLGIIGFPQSGKSTIFAALTGARGKEVRKGPQRDQRLGAVRVMDERVDFLSGIYQPKKTTYGQVEYLLPSEVASGSETITWSQTRVCDALIHVVRNFAGTGEMESESEDDFWRLEEEMILNDLMVTEKRLERIELDLKRGRKPDDDDEYSLLRSSQELLENSDPLRSRPEIASAPALKGFTFLSAKPQLIIINNDDEDETMPIWNKEPDDTERLVVRGRLEMEISSMSEEEAEEFLIAYNIKQSALDRVIQTSYRILNLVSFFTVGSDEVKAWTIGRGIRAPEAAGTVHSDMQKGFIRAEVLSFDDLREYGSYKEAKKAGRVRLEGKEYIVHDGDVINFMFNV